MLFQKLAATSLALALLGLGTVNANDTFNYYGTNLTTRSFGPTDWKNVTCNNVSTCPGWPTNWENFNPWLPYSTTTNKCLDCSKPPATVLETRACRKGFQSPIDLPRNITGTKTCFDRHRMNYVRGNCRFNQMDFQILPHVLRVYQPPVCGVQPTIDFSRGYPVPWNLEYTDISVPSQHTIDGRRYDAEVSLHHTYGANGFDRLVGSVAIFLVNGTDADHYDFLELYLREWQRKRMKVRADCGARAARALQQHTAKTTTSTPAVRGTMLETATLENDKDTDSWNADGKDVNEEELDQGWRDAVLQEPINVGAHSDLPWRRDDENEKDVDKANADKDDELERRDLQLFLQRTRRPTRSPTRSPAPSITPAPSSTPTMALQILNFPYFNRLWQPYDWVNACKTEYYFKYLGSLVEPPCFVGVHWRIMRSPIKISPRQLRILSTLLAFRQDPITCKTMSSVGKPRKDGSSFVDVNRPIQRLQGQHDLAFCECVDWNSSIIEDKTYCQLTMEQRGVLPSPAR